MKLYRFKSSGMQKRPCYYGAAFISSKHEVDSHIKHVYSKAPRSKNAMDNMCGESHWKAADNTARRRAKLDETGLEIAGCRHGLAQWAVNMYQGEIYGYAHFVQSQKMFPAGVKIFWQDIVCKYWKWARKVGGPEMSMKPALSVMHAKAHKWSCQVLWGGRWQEGTACTTGEEVEQINAHMSRCGNTSKYMLPEGRDELLTEHALSWNRRKIFAMIPNLVKRFTRATAMFASSKEDCAVILQQYNLQLKDIDVHLWKQEIIQHAKDEEIMSSSRVSPCNSEKEKIKQQMEMLSFSIARTTKVINKQTDTSKQRTRLRKKITSERSQLKKLMDQFNALVESNGGVPLTIDNVLAVEPSLGGNDQCACNELPIRVKSKIVDAFQIHDRWTEEIALLKLEMSNLLCFYTEKRIPALKKDILELEDEIKSWVDCEQRTSEITENNEQGGKDEQTVVKYSCLDSRPELLQGKIALLKKGLAFCSEQVRTATGCFQKIIDGDTAITNDTLCNDCDEETDHSDNDDTDSDDSDDDGETRDPSFSVSSSEEKAPMRAFSNCNTTCIWEFPYHISQSTYNGRNGSNACSIISLLIAQGIHQVNCDLLPSPMLPSLWVTLVCGCIKVGNDLYDRSRGSLPQRYLSAAEAAMVAGDKLEVSIRQPFPVRICDSHQPSTMRYQLLDLCNNQHTSFAVLTVDEKTVLFAGIRKEKLVLIDTHLHGQQGAIIILGKPCNVDNFVCAVQQCLGFHNDTFGNLVHIHF